MKKLFIFFFSLVSCTSPIEVESVVTTAFNTVVQSRFPALMDCVARKNPTIFGPADLPQTQRKINDSNRFTAEQWQNPQTMDRQDRETLQLRYDNAVRLGCVRG
jgi:hypothetical protein